MRTRFTIQLLILACCSTASLSLGQDEPAARSLQRTLPVPRWTCPGDPAGALGSIDCSFTMTMRLQEFLGGSVTDQAALEAIFFGGFAQWMDSPKEWKQDWTGFGYRVGSRYAQGAAKGLAELAVGAAMRTDPRHVSYLSDPGRVADCETIGQVKQRDHSPKVMPRVGHAFLDWVSVRQSSPCNGGKRLPNLPLFAGAAASGFVGNAWYPEELITPGQAGIRASYSLATALGSSFYTEFQPEIGRALGWIFKRRAGAKGTAAASPATSPDGGVKQ